MKLTPDQLKEIRERSSELDGPFAKTLLGQTWQEISDEFLDQSYSDEESAFFSHALFDIPGLLDHIEVLERENEALTQLTALHFDDECLTCRDGDPCGHKQLIGKLETIKKRTPHD